MPGLQGITYTVKNTQQRLQHTRQSSKKAIQAAGSEQMNTWGFEMMQFRTSRRNKSVLFLLFW